MCYVFPGWLFRRKDLLLAVVVSPGKDAAAPSAPGTAGVGGAGSQTQPGEWHAGESGMVNVVGLREGGGGELSDCNGRDLSMLLRLQGPEALAEVGRYGGSAI